MKPILFAFLTCAVLLVSEARADDISRTDFIADDKVRIEPDPRSPRKIPGLAWQEDSLKYESPAGAGQPGKIVLIGKVEKGRSGNLMYSTGGLMKITKVDDTGTFRIDLPVRERKQRLSMRAIDAYGNVYDEYFNVTAQIDSDIAGKKFLFDVGAGISYLAYKERAGTSEIKITEIGLTAKVGASYRLSRKIELAASSFVTALPMPISKTTTVSGADESQLQSTRWYGINGRVGYKLPFGTEGQSSYYLMTGYYAWGMIVPAALQQNLTYGVSFLGGMQFFLSGRFVNAAHRSWYTYLKFATIQDQSQGLFSTQNREIAAGIGYQLTPTQPDRRRWMGTLDIADASYDNGMAGSKSQSFELLSFSLGASTTF